MDLKSKVCILNNDKKKKKSYPQRHRKSAPESKGKDFCYSAID